MSYPGSRQVQGKEFERLSSSDDERTVHVLGRACTARDNPDACVELLYELERLMGGMLVNAQVMQWKLPPYSHSKRYVREIERSAQRGGSIVQQLLRHMGDTGLGDGQLCSEIPALAGVGISVTAQEPTVHKDAMASQYRSLSTHAAPAFSQSRPRRAHINL